MHLGGNIKTKGLLLALCLPLVSACSLTGGSLGSQANLDQPAQPSGPNLGPSQYASVVLPERSEILGQGTSYLSDLLGTPSLKRTEQGVELWQYQSASCVALFYLYEANGTLTVNHYDARARSDAFGAVSEELCMKEIVGTFGAKQRS